jgi:hypothetical protein
MQHRLELRRGKKPVDCSNRYVHRSSRSRGSIHHAETRRRTRCQAHATVDRGIVSRRRCRRHGGWRGGTVASAEISCSDRQAARSAHAMHRGEQRHHAMVAGALPSTVTNMSPIDHGVTQDSAISVPGSSSAISVECPPRATIAFWPCGENVLHTQHTTAQQRRVGKATLAVAHPLLPLTHVQVVHLQQRRKRACQLD